MGVRHGELCVLGVNACFSPPTYNGEDERSWLNADLHLGDAVSFVSMVGPCNGVVNLELLLDLRLLAVDTLAANHNESWFQEGRRYGRLVSQNSGLESLLTSRTIVLSYVCARPPCVKAPAYEVKSKWTHTNIYQQPLLGAWTNLSLLSTAI